MTEPRHANPDPETPADDADELDWDPERDGAMADHADDEPPATEPYDEGQ